jgi:CPA1 family monovalent cation:H+ antiporter
VIRVLGLAKAGDRELQTDSEEELLARRRATEAATERLDELAAERGLPDDVVRRLRTKQWGRLRHFERKREQGEDQEFGISPPDEIELALITAERERLNELYRRGTLKDEARRRLERELDLREANLASHQHDE